jgi:geranylgeranyl pyrophosphate synthase
MPYPEPVVEEVIDLVRAGDHVEEALQEATRRLDLASKALAALPDGKPRQILETLGSYLVERVDAAKT